MKVLFLHGWQSTPGGTKPAYLRDHGHEVFNPALPDDDFDAAVRIAQAEFNRHRPDVVVGSSRGGAVAMNIQSDQTRLVLLCPAWKRWGTAHAVKPGTIILHSPEDEIIPLAETQRLIQNSGLPRSALCVVGHDHRLADPVSLRAMLDAVELTCDWEIPTTEPGRALAYRPGIGALVLMASLTFILIAVAQAAGSLPSIFYLAAAFFAAVGLAQGIPWVAGRQNEATRFTDDLSFVGLWSAAVGLSIVMANYLLPGDLIAADAAPGWIFGFVEGYAAGWLVAGAVRLFG